MQIHKDTSYILLLKVWDTEPHSEVLCSTPHSPEGVHMQPVKNGGYTPVTPCGGDQDQDSEFRNSKRDMLM